MELKLIQYSVLVIFLFLQAACSKNDCETQWDQVKYADSIEFNGKTYFLYTRTTGWHNKVVFFELYDVEPSFDQCGKINTSSVYVVDYDYFPDDPNSEEKYVQKIILQPDKPEKLKIIYTKNKEEGFANVYDVKFSRWYIRENKFYLAFLILNIPESERVLFWWVGIWVPAKAKGLAWCCPLFLAFLSDNM